MCQLTFCKFQTPIQTKIFTTLSIISNTFASHHDGWGIYGGETIFKTHMNAQSTSDIGKIIEEYHLKNSPIISHVRFASYGTKVVSDNSHPFETNSFILAHNGTLTIKKGAEDYIDELKKGWGDKKDLIDSETFALVLEEEYKREKKIPKTLINAMSSFCGKFAFIIYCKPENNYYIVRGKTADLHVTTFIKDNVNIGLVVNTEEVSLLRTVHLFESTMQSIGQDITNTEIQELNEETVYLYRANKLIEVGKIKESEKEIVPFSSVDYSRTRTNILNGTMEEDVKLINKTIEFLDTYSLTMDDLDRILFFTLEKGILTIDADELQLFFSNVVTRFQPKKHFKKDIAAILFKYKYNCIPYGFYKKLEFQYPYMLIKNRSEQLSFVGALDKYLKEIDDKSTL